MRLLHAVTTIASWTLISRILGFARDIVMAAMLGTGLIADAFLIAFKLPNLFRRLLAEGAFSAAFVPMFAKRLHGDGLDNATEFAARVVAVMSVVLLSLLVIFEIFMPYIVPVIAPGFAVGSESYELTVSLCRITFPYLVFIVWVALFSGMLNSIGAYRYGAASPVLLNIVLLAALWLLVPYTKTPGHALAWGVFAAGIGQFLWLLYGLKRENMLLPVRRPRLSADVKSLLGRMAPGLLGAGVMQINVMVDMILASLLAEGAISYLYYADRLNQLPLSLVGATLGTALLPMLSAKVRAGDQLDVQALQQQALQMGLFLALPAAAALVTIAYPLISGLFERGAFTTEASAATSGALQAFATGLPAYIIVKVFASVFFANDDTRTPVWIAAGAVVLNVALNLILMRILGHVGIALATAISAWVNAACLGWILWKRSWWQPHAALGIFCSKVLLATGSMILTLILLMHYSAAWPTIPRLLIIIIGGSCAYFAVVFASKTITFRQLKQLKRRHHD